MNKNPISKNVKKIWFIFILLLSITLVSCSFNHKHSESKWIYNETEHWRVPVCNRKNCALEQVVYDLGEHIDKDWDHSCDSCGYEIEHKHISGEWQYDAFYHWVSSIYCTWDCCDINPAIYEHIDDDKDRVCDTCNYSFINGNE